MKLKYLLLFQVIFVVISLPYVKENINDQFLGPYERFEYMIPREVFKSDLNASIFYSVSSHNNWIKTGLGRDIIQSGYFYPRYSGIDVYEFYAYIADQFYGLRIFDCSDLTSPKLVGSLYFENGITRDIIVRYPYAYLANGAAGMSVVDVSDPFDPKVVGKLDNAEANEVRGVFIEGDYVYLANGRSGILIADITNRTEPFIVSSYDPTTSTFYRLWYVDDYVYVAQYTGGFVIINAADKASPIITYTLSSDNSYDVQVVGNTAYVAIRNQGMGLIDVTDKDLPVIVKRFAPVPIVNTLGVLVEDEFAYLCSCYSTRSFVIANVSDINRPKEVGTYDSTDHCDNINCQFAEPVPSLDLRIINYYVDDERQHKAVVVADYNRGLKIYNATDKTNPEMIGRYGTYTGKAVHAFVKGNWLYILDEPHGLLIVDITNKASPVLTGRYDSPSQAASRVFVDDKDYAYIASSSAGLYIIDVSDKSNPVHRKSYDNAASYNDVVVRGNYAYLGVSNYGIEILNVENPVSPVFVGKSNSATCYRIAVIGDYVYGASSTSGISIYDVSDKANPRLIRYFKDAGTVSDVYGDESNSDILYGLYQNWGFFILDVSNNTKPVRIGIYDMNPLNIITVPYDIFVVNNPDRSRIMAYVVDLNYGLFVFDVTNNNSITHNGTYKSKDPDPLNLETAKCFSVFVDVDNYIYIADGRVGVKILGGEDIVLYDSKDDTFHCGNLTVRIYASDSEGTISEDFVISRSYNQTDPNLLCQGKGKCYNHTKCDCDEGWDGKNCEFPTCFSISSDSIHTCNGHGDCLAPGVCNCTSPDYYFGPKCLFIYCFGIGSDNGSFVCGGHGNCLERDRCDCSDGYDSIIPFGECVIYECQGVKFNDHKVCSGRGECIEYNRCRCSEGYEGEDCGNWRCGANLNDHDLVCSNNGKCKSPNECRCQGPYIGDECQINQLYLTVMTPLLSVFSAGLVICVVILICIICILCFVGFISLIVCLGYCSITVLRQKVFLKRFLQLRDFDLYLKEQELEEDTSMAEITIRKSLFVIDFDEIKVSQILGEGGSNSVVFKAWWKSKIVAFKCFKTRHLMSNQDNYDEFEREVDVMANIKHPHIISFYGATLKPPRVGIVMEFCENGDLDIFLADFKRKYEIQYPFKEKLRMCFEISTSLEYLHDRKILHRDVKLANVLINSSFSCKLMDFGLSRLVDRMSQVKTKKIGTGIYMAPEIVQGEENYSEKIDVYSFGIMVWVVFTEERYAYGSDQFPELKVANDPDYRPEIETLEDVLSEFEDDVDYDWISELVTSSWDHDAVNRPSFQTISQQFQSSMEKHGSFSTQVEESIRSSIAATMRGKKSTKRVSDEIVDEDDDDVDEENGWKEKFEKEKKEKETFREKYEKLLKKVEREEGSDDDDDDEEEEEESEEEEEEESEEEEEEEKEEEEEEEECVSEKSTSSESSHSSDTD